MAITLKSISVPALTKKIGEEKNLVLTAGKMLKIETTPGGAEILDEVVPAGKQWTVVVGVNIDEVDA